MACHVLKMRPNLDWVPSPFGQLACIKKKAGKFLTGNTFPNSTERQTKKNEEEKNNSG